MNKVFKVILTGLISLFIILQVNFVYAASINMNLQNTSKENKTTTSKENTNENKTSKENEEDKDNEDNVDSEEEITDNEKSPIADTLHSLPEAELGLSNVLNIILIAVGVVLILLAIAIFIKLR